MTKKKLLTIFVSLVLGCTALFTLMSCSNGELTGIEITTAPTKTTYIEGDEFDPTGMVVTATYSNDKTKELSAKDYTYDLTEALTTSNKKVTVSYTEGEGENAVTKTATVNITVTNDVTAATIKTHATKIEYILGEVFDPTGMVVTVTRQNGAQEDIDVATNGICSWSKDPLTAGATSVEISVGGKPVTETIQVKNGIFIEAETAEITSTTVDLNTDSPEATGGMYVGDMMAGDSISFNFIADKAGIADIEFRLASLYLKEDNNWIPIWMGDCQFNLICQFTVNGVAYDIPDSVILPGGGESGGTPDSSLWFNWQYVTFNNIDLVAGENTVVLTFIPHNYTDTSQTSFSGKFTANVDSLKVSTTDVVITPVEAGEEVA